MDARAVRVRAVSANAQKPFDATPARKQRALRDGNYLFVTAGFFACGFQLTQEDAACQRASLKNLRVREAIGDRCPLPACRHDPTLAEEREVLGDVRLAQPRGGDQFADRSLPRTDQVDQFEAGGIGEDLAELGLQGVEFAFAFIHRAVLHSHITVCECNR